jgi:predicted porin
MKYKTDTWAKFMSETAGFSGNEGVSCFGVERKGEIGLQFWGYRAHEMWDDIYLCVDYRPEASHWHVGARYLNRNSSDSQLAGNQDSWHIGITAGKTLGNFEFSTAYSQNGDRNILRKWGHETTISNQVMVADRAKEEAWLVCLKYTLPAVEKVQLSFSLANHNTPDSGNYQSPDREEYNFDIKYDLLRMIPGLSLRGRYAWINESGDHAEDLRDLRLYLRYQHDFT